jgi:hypothetical protein
MLNVRPKAKERSMSGGSFDYNCFRISQFADDLNARIDTNEMYDENNYGDGFALETIDMLKRCHTIIEKAGKLAHHVEWLYSGDHGEDSFMRLATRDVDA